MGDGPVDDAKYRIARAALESGKIAALNEGLDQTCDILIVLEIGEGDRAGASLSTLDPEDHLQLLARAIQGFGEATGQGVKVLMLNDAQGGQG